MRENTEQQTTTRRELLKVTLAAMAAAGMSLLSPATAFAGTDGDLVVGADNDGGSSSTGLQSSAASPSGTLAVSNSGSGAAAKFTTSGAGSAVVATATKADGNQPVIDASHSGTEGVGMRAATSGMAGTALVVESTQPTFAPTMRVTGNGNGTTVAIQAGQSTGLAVQGGSNSGTASVFVTSAHAWCIEAQLLDTASGCSTARLVTVGTGPAVEAYSSSGYGVQASGGKAQLYLTPNESSGPPTSDTHATGEVYVDTHGVRYRCMAGGSPGVWVEDRSTILLPAPVRAIDTRNGTGGIQGPLATNKVRTFPSFLSALGIPAMAVGLVGNLTMVAPAGLLTGAGWMAIVPATLPNGTARTAAYPGVSTINTPTGTDACANQFTVKVGVYDYTGQISIVSYSARGQAYHALVDVAGYIV